MLHSQQKCLKKKYSNDQSLGHQQNQNLLRTQDREINSSPLINQYNKWRGVLHLSQKRMVESLKRFPIRKVSLFQNVKQGKLQLNFNSVSNSKSNISSKSDHSKMPDLIKLKLKKQLQNFQKNPNNTNKDKSKFSQQSQQKINRMSSILLDFKDQSRYKKFQISKSCLKNSKKPQEPKSIMKNYDISQEEKIGKPINLNEKRKANKYFQLLDYANNDLKPNSPDRNGSRNVNRVITQSAAHSKLIDKGVNSLELQGTQISEDSSLLEHKLKLVELFQQTIMAKQIQELYLFRKRKQSQEKSLRKRLVKSQGKKSKMAKNQEISPWISPLQQIENHTNLFDSQY